ncbi:MAG: aminodeoxychorismate synthase component I [Desulfobulbaceae bacterium]|jgi:para-aminobenzoate synthetase component 1|nr:aminodeoxychorismate synthase component I [Desulfobulbaceae bacterium]
MQIIRKREVYQPIDQIFARFAHSQDVAFLNSSLENNLGRYSIIGLNPYLKLVKGEKFTINGECSSLIFEDYLRDYLARNYQINPTKLPLVCGAIGYFSYEYGRKLQGVSSKFDDVSGDLLTPRQPNLPDCVLTFYDNFVIEDHVAKEIFLVANGKLGNSEKTLADLENNICNINNTNTPIIQKESRTAGSNMTATRQRPELTCNFNQEEYIKAVESMIEYIINGDIYVVNMAMQMQARSAKRPYELFKILRQTNPSPFSAYLNYANFTVICCSPERFLQIKNGHIVTRPIKGTRKRGETPEEDAALKQELMDSAKEKSELLMVVDLERNDLNKVCTPGSVIVSDMYGIEEYATVFHLVSTVEGHLRENSSPVDLLVAAAPGGSITGTPKIRAMELIDELENSPRGLYTGTLGFISLNGDCDLNIIIRTAVYENGIYYIGVGGGITYDSDPLFEYEEALQKASALLKVLVSEEKGEGTNAD